MANYLEDLAAAVAANVYPQGVSFSSDMARSKGAVIGERDGLILCLANVSTGNGSALMIAVRARSLSNPEEAVAAVKALPGCKSFITGKQVRHLQGAIVVFWSYTLKKPALDAIRALVQEIMMTVQPWAARFDGKCEDCGSVPVSGIVLQNGTPGYHCPACQQRLAGDSAQRAAEYAQRPARHVLGAVAGIAATAAAAVLWGLLVGYLDNKPNAWHPKLHIAGAVWIGLAASISIMKATGRVTRFAQGLAVVLTLAGKLAADALYFALWIGVMRNLAWSVPLQLWVLKHLWALKTMSGMRIVVFVTDVVLAACLPLMPWAKMPQFKAVFEPLSATAQAAVAAKS